MQSYVVVSGTSLFLRFLKDEYSSGSLGETVLDEETYNKIMTKSDGIWRPGAEYELEMYNMEKARKERDRDWSSSSSSHTGGSSEWTFGSVLFVFLCFLCFGYFLSSTNRGDRSGDERYANETNRSNIRTRRANRVDPEAVEKMRQKSRVRMLYAVLEPHTRKFEQGRWHEVNQLRPDAGELMYGLLYVEGVYLHYHVVSMVCNFGDIGLQYIHDDRHFYDVPIMENIKSQSLYVVVNENKQIVMDALHSPETGISAAIIITNRADPLFDFLSTQNDGELSFRFDEYSWVTVPIDAAFRRTFKFLSDDCLGQ